MNTKINQRKHRRFVFKVVEAAAVIAITVVLFNALERAAYAERGYEAIGGEYGALLFPLFWISAKGIIKDIRNGILSVRKGGYED